MSQSNRRTLTARKAGEAADAWVAAELHYCAVAAVASRSRLEADNRRAQKAYSRARSLGERFADELSVLLEVGQGQTASELATSAMHRVERGRHDLRHQWATTPTRAAHPLGHPGARWRPEKTAG